jgi:nitrilase
MDNLEYHTFSAAIVQESPVFLDRDRTIDKVDDLASSAAAQGANLVVFGESFLPGFPIWNAVLRPIDQHGFFKRLVENSIEVPGESTERLARIARKYSVHLSIGVTERCVTRPATMWNSNLIFSPEGVLVGHHRKLVPTWAEKLTWAYGDARGLQVLDTNIGRLGTLICGENFNTLGRFALLAMGEQVHISTYPPIWPVNPGSPSRDRNTELGGPPSRVYNLSEAVRIRASAHAIEGKVFNIVAATNLDDDAVDAVAQGDDVLTAYLQDSARGCSMIIHPSGAVLAEIGEGKQGIALADVDTGDALPLQELHDIAGHYNRFDVYRLSVNTSPNEALSDFVHSGRAGAESRVFGAAEGPAADFNGEDRH